MVSRPDCQSLRKFETVCARTKIQTEMKFTKQDIETMDFIQSQMVMNENCDSYGVDGLEEKYELFNKANDLLFRLADFIIKNQRKHQ